VSGVAELLDCSACLLGLLARNVCRHVATLRAPGPDARVADGGAVNVVENSQETESTNARVVQRCVAIREFEQQKVPNGAMIGTYLNSAWLVPKNLSKLLCYLLRIDVKLCFCPRGWESTGA
jgi:hypothetical protein